MCAWIVWIRSLSPSNHPRSDHAPIVIVIQSEHLKLSISPRNQSAKHPDSGCFGISEVVIGSALSKGWRSGPEAFRAGHFWRLDRNRSNSGTQGIPPVTHWRNLNLPFVHRLNHQYYKPKISTGFGPPKKLNETFYCFPGFNYRITGVCPVQY